MSITTITAKVTEKNTRPFTNKNGQEQLILNTQILEGNKQDDIPAVYGSAFLPPFIKIGDVVTVSGRTKATKFQKQDGTSGVSYNFEFPTVMPVYIGESGATKSTQSKVPAEGFGRTSDFDVSEEDLPF